MADVFDFYVRDNRKITFDIAEPIMREDSGVTDFRFHIPKTINGLDMSDWAWWLVFVNAKKEKYSIALTLSDDPESPLEKNIATYTVDYAMSIKAGSVQFALEAINTGTGGAINNEWHTLTYETKVKETLQGNQAEYSETESDIISALLEEVRNKVNQLVGGATPLPVNLKSLMTDPQKVYLYIGSEPNEYAGHWYYHNGATFVSGGVYGAGVVDPVPTQGSTNAVSSGGVYSALAEIQSDVSDIQTAISTEVKSKNLINPDVLTVGRLQADGTINTTMSNYATSDYIPLEAGKTYVFAREKMNVPGEAMITGYAGYGFYDTSKTWVANSRIWNNYTDSTNPPIFTITPESDCYIRVCGNKDYFGTDTNGNFIFQEGSALDGYEAYYTPYKENVVLTKSAVKQTAGESTTDIMSQKAVKDYVDNHMPAELEDIADAFYTVVGKNKYNPTVCNPENGKYYNLTTGVSASAANYAITGKIPVEAETRYIFSAGSAYVFTAQFYSGETGDTFISATGDLSGGSFVTPQNCTFVGINLFARSHTTEQYNAAIAASQLELGSVATTYEPYTETVTLSDENIENGSSLSDISELTEKISLINLYDKTLAEDGKYVNTSHTISTNADWAWTGKIPVVPNTQYCITQSGSAPVPFTTALDEWGQDGSWVNTQTPSGAYGYEIPFITGANTYFISCNMKLTSHTTQNFEDTIDTIMLCLGTQRPLTYSPYNPVPSVLVDRLSDMYVANRECYTGKKWLATGTSITWYDGKAYSAGVHTGEICRGYIGNVARRKKLLVTNSGISGSTLFPKNQDSLINRYQSLDWAGADIATLEYGVNDFGNAVPVGTAEDVAGTDTFAACLKTVIEYALAQNPAICLVICTEPDVRGNTANTGGHYLKEYTDVTLAIAEQYRLPVCDWYYKSGINALNKGDSSTDKMTADGTHPNDKGHMRMGAMLNQVFDGLLC